MILKILKTHKRISVFFWLLILPKVDSLKITNLHSDHKLIRLEFVRDDDNVLMNTYMVLRFWLILLWCLPDQFSKAISYVFIISFVIWLGNCISLWVRRFGFSWGMIDLKYKTILYRAYMKLLGYWWVYLITFPMLSAISSVTFDFKACKEIWTMNCWIWIDLVSLW